MQENEKLVQEKADLVQENLVNENEIEKLVQEKENENGDVGGGIDAETQRTLQDLDIYAGAECIVYDAIDMQDERGEDENNVSIAVQTVEVCCFSAEEMEQFMRKVEDRDDMREKLSEKRMEEVLQKMKEMQLQYQKVFEDMAATNSAQLDVLQTLKQQMVTLTAERDLFAEECRKHKKNLEK